MLLVCGALLSSSVAVAQDFDRYFLDRTLRCDYIFAGNSTEQMVAFDEFAEWDGWAGRRHNLDSLLLLGNGELSVKDVASGEVIYRTSFSSLYQEWVYDTASSSQNTMSYQFTILVPMPKAEAEITVSLRNQRHEVIESLSHRFQPDDILIRNFDGREPTRHEWLLRSGSSDEAIDIAILAEGYTEEEMGVFMEDARRTVDILFGYEPYASYRDRFNVVAVAAPSEDSDVTIPRKDLWRNTAVSSHFDTFYSDRYLTVKELHKVYDLLAGIPAEHIILLANTDTYGGGGIFNSYALTTAHNSLFPQVMVHEFGHSFAGLGDEYFYAIPDPFTATLYPADVEPWEPNITNLTDFQSKWAELIPEGTPMPTPEEHSHHDCTTVGLYEGGGYLLKGMYRPTWDCRMRTNEAPTFCPVCQRAIERTILYHTEEFSD